MKTPLYTNEDEIKENGFELFYYNDTNFKNVSLHTHDFYEFYFFEEGDAFFEYKKQRYNLSKGDILMIPSGISHRIAVRDASVTYRRFVLWVQESWLRENLPMTEEYQTIFSYVGEEHPMILHNTNAGFDYCRNLLFCMISCKDSSYFGNRERSRIYLLELFLLLNIQAHEKNQTPEPAPEHTINRLIHYIEHHLSDPLDLVTLSNRFFLSKFYISRLFKEQTGVSLHQYITKKRVQLCRDGLLRGDNISKTFKQYGFSDYTTCYRAFCREYGMPPTQYANKYR